MIAQTGGPATAVRAHEEIFAYWASLRSAGRLPGRADIHPADFKRHLPTISLTDVRRDPRDYRMRLAGTGLYGVYGREITGQALACTTLPGAALATSRSSGSACRWQPTAPTSTWSSATMRCSACTAT